MKEEKTSFFKNNKGFYLVLAACLVAVGVVAWSAVSSVTDLKNTVENSKSEEYSDPDISYNINTPDVPTKPNEQPTDTTVTDAEYDGTKDDEKSPEISAEVAEYFIIPLSGNITKNFSDKTLQYSKTFGDMRLHSGIDISSDVGTTVKSAGSGTVTEIYKDAMLGTTVIIDHGNGIIIKYCGLNDNTLVNKSDTVLAGTELGSLGSVPSETADGSHLHLEVYKDGVAVSPLEALNAQ